jgi:hypothetical protein
MKFVISFPALRAGYFTSSLRDLSRKFERPQFNQDEFVTSSSTGLKWQKRATQCIAPTKTLHIDADEFAYRWRAIRMNNE